MKSILICIIMLIAIDRAFGQPSPDTLWTVRIGGDSIDYCHAIKQTVDGGYILAGETNSYGQHQSDAYLVKLNSGGSMQWSNTFGTDNDFSSNSFAAVEQTSDQGYILAGRTTLSNWTSAYIVKTDADGDTVWTCVFDDPHSMIDVYGRAVLQTADGGYLIAGYAASAFPAHGYICLFRTDANGDTLWTRIMRAREAIAYETCDAIFPASDGGYVLAGHRYPEGSNNVDGLFVKVTETGIVEWWHSYGHDSYDAFSSIAGTADGGYIIAGRSYVSASQSMDLYIVRTTALGDTIWTRRIGGPSEDIAVSAFEVEGGFIVGGQTRSYGAGNDDLSLVKLDANGVQLWSRTYGGSGYDWCDEMQRTTDGGYVLCGSTGSFGVQGYDMYVVKTGPDQAGSNCPLLCEDAYPISVGVPLTECSFPEAGQHWFSIQLAPGIYRFQLDGFSGSTDYDLYTYLNCSDSDPTECSGLAVGPEDFMCQITVPQTLLVEVDTYAGPYGSYRLLISSTESVDPQTESLPTEFELSVYPNPFNPNTTITFALPTAQFVRLAAYDISGRRVQMLLDSWMEAGTHHIKFNGQALPSGMYLAQIQAGTIVQTRKLILLK